LKQIGVQATPEQVEDILKRVKELGIKKKGLVNDDEFRNIVNKIS